MFLKRKQLRRTNCNIKGSKSPSTVDAPPPQLSFLTVLPHTRKSIQADKLPNKYVDHEIWLLYQGCCYPRNLGSFFPLDLTSMYLHLILAVSSLTNFHEYSIERTLQEICFIL